MNNPFDDAFEAKLARPPLATRLLNHIGIHALIIGVLLVVASSGVAWWLHTQDAAAQKFVENEVGRIQAAGEPITIQDLYQDHRAPPGTADITPFWMAVIDGFDARQFNFDGKTVAIVGTDGPAALDPGDEAGLAAASDFLQKYDKTIQATLDAARETGESRFPVTFEAGMTAFLPHVPKLRLISRLLLLRSQSQRARGDIEGALESIDAIFAASDSLSHQLLLVEHLVRLAIFGVALKEAQELIGEQKLSNEQLTDLQKRLTSSDVQAALTRALYGERAMSYLTFQNLDTLAKSQPLKGRQLVLDTGGKLTRPADCLMSLELFAETIDASHQLFPAALTQVQEVESRLKTMVGSRNPLHKVQYRYTLALFPAARAAFEADGRALASRDALIAAIAAERHRLKHGTYPSRLDELVPDFLPAIPIDPFDGRPLRFVRSDDGLRIYSVGRNRKDDGGMERTTGEPDIVVQLGLGQTP